MDTATRSLLIEAAYRTLFFEQLLSFVTFPFVCFTAFEAFECEEIDTREYRLIADYNIRGVRRRHSNSRCSQPPCTSHNLSLPLPLQSVARKSTLSSQ